MHPVDWAIIAAYIAWISWDGLRLSKRSTGLEGYLLAGRSLPWWAVGLSVMATQLSAITMIGTTGQGYQSGMGLLQQYYALPIAMVTADVQESTRRAGLEAGAELVVSKPLSLDKLAEALTTLLQVDAGR